METSNNPNNNFDEIDLLLVFGRLKRNKYFIFSFSLILSVFSIIYNKSKDPIYRGTFQIVVKDSRSGLSNRNSLNFLPNNILTNNVLKVNNNNKTQEFILKSPSVLNPVYKFNLKEYKNRGQDVSKLSYKLWLSQSLDIEFIDKTDILEIRFVDKDKKLIISNLNMISEKYKNFSRRDRKKNISKSIKYLENQQKILRPKLIKSLKEVNEFALDNGLGNTGELISSNSGFNLSEQNSQSLNINGIQSTLDQRNKDRDKFRYKNQFDKLEKYETAYTELSSKLMPNSKTLKELKNKIETLKLSLKRPTEILIEYRSLTEIAERNEKSLTFIENSLAELKLESAKQQDPWELISIPTLEDRKIAPKTKDNAILTFFSSAIFASLIILIKENNLGKIYYSSELKAKLKCKFLGNLYSSNTKISDLILQKIIKENSSNLDIAKNKKNIALVYINNQIKETIPISNLNNFVLCDLKDEKNIDKCKKLILIVGIGDTSQSELLFINEYINVFKNKLIGWVFLDTKN